MQSDTSSAGSARWRQSFLWNKATHGVNRLLYGMPDRYGHLERQISQHRCRTILEIGVWDGERSKLMIRAALRQARPDEVAYHGFDLFEDAEPDILLHEFSKAPPTMASVQGKLVEFERQGVTIRLYKGDTLEVLPRVVDRLDPFDFIFVDGGHSYETVSNDWRYVSRLLHPGSVVIFDDYYNREALGPTGAGVNQVVDALDRRIYDVRLLQPVDVYAKPWGLQKIRFARVTPRGGSNPPAR